MDEIALQNKIDDDEGNDVAPLTQELIEELTGTTLENNDGDDEQKDDEVVVHKIENPWKK